MICDIGTTLHRSGCAPYKIEKYVQHYARKHGVTVVVQASPTAITYQFPDNENQVVMKRLEPASINLALLANTIIEINQSTNKVPPEPVSYPGVLVMMANIAIPPAFLVLVGSSMQAIGIAAVLGFMVWVCQLICRNERIIVVEFLSALVTGLTVAWMSSHGFPLPVWGLCIAAIVLFVPGLSIANSLECLAFNDIQSGTSLFGQSIFIFMKLFIGIFIGLNIGETLWGEAESIANVSEVAPWMPYMALPVLSCALGVIFNARAIDILLAFPVTVLGMWGPLYLDLGAGWIVGTWITTVCITFYGTWLAKKLNLTGAIYIVQGIIILVPGSRVLMGATQSLYGESLMPSQSVGLSALFIFSAIVAGQITAYSMYSQKNRNLIS